MKKILKWAVSPDSWIKAAVILLILGILAIFARSFEWELSDVLCVSEYFEVLVKPLFAASAFCIGFSLTLRATAASEQSTQAKNAENEIKKSELIYSVSRSEFDKFKQIMDNLENSTVGALDSIFDLYTVSIDSTRKLEKISMILEQFINKWSSPTNIRDLDAEWRGTNENMRLNANIQQAVNVFFSEGPLNIVGLKLTNVNLQRINLSKRKIENVDFGGSAMHAASMYESEFIKCKFNTSMLQGANLSKCKFIDCDFSSSFLMCSNLYGAYFYKCNMYGVDFSCTLLTECKFKDSDLRNARLDGADILHQDPNTEGIRSENCELDGVSKTYCLCPQEFQDCKNVGYNRYSRILGYWSKADSQNKKILKRMYDVCIHYAVEDNYVQINKMSLQKVIAQMEGIVKKYNEVDEK